MSVIVTTDTDTVKIEGFSPDKKGNFIKLLTPITVYLDKNGKKTEHIIPSGHLSDGASIPSYVWSILKLYPTHPDILLAAICHDYFYRTPSVKISRSMCDEILFQLCKCSKAKARIIYYAVRGFGRFNFKKRNK